MKIFDWVKVHKYPLVVSGLFIAAILCIVFFIQGLKKDYTLELVNQKLQLKEDARVQIEKVRTPLEEEKIRLKLQILELGIRDSLTKILTDQNNSYIQKLSTPQYAKEKTKAIDAISDTDLAAYFNNLPNVPEPNDYNP
jgi:preprotein translocase subunit SecF